MIAGMERGGGAGPGSADSLEVDASGTWRALRMAGSDQAGSFGAQLDAAALAKLETDVAAAVEAGPPSREAPWPAGGSVDTFWAGEVVAQLAADEEPPDAWAPLVASCRALLDGSADNPVAAIALTPTADGELRHVGHESVPTDGAGFAVEATVFGSDGSTHGSWTGAVAAPQQIPAGWSAPIGLGESGLAPANGQTVGVTVTFAFVEGLPRQATLWAST
jgi:hypothetical protein